MAEHNRTAPREDTLSHHFTCQMKRACPPEERWRHIVAMTTSVAVATMHYDANPVIRPSLNSYFPRSLGFWDSGGQPRSGWRMSLYTNFKFSQRYRILPRLHVCPPPRNLSSFYQILPGSPYRNFFKTVKAEVILDFLKAAVLYMLLWRACDSLFSAWRWPHEMEHHHSLSFDPNIGRTEQGVL